MDAVNAAALQVLELRAHADIFAFIPGSIKRDPGGAGPIAAAAFSARYLRRQPIRRKTKKGEIVDTRNLFFFDAMLTPKIITLVYWLLLLGALVSGIGIMFGNGFSFGHFIKAVAVMIGGAIGARIWCELLIVLFKIHENTRKIASSK